MSTVVDSTITRSMARDTFQRVPLPPFSNGGAFYCFGGTLSVDRSTISHCSATLDGGAFYVGNQDDDSVVANLELEGVTIIGCAYRSAAHEQQTP